MTFRVFGVLVLMQMILGMPGLAQDVWKELEPGLELARFDWRSQEVDPEGELVVLRVDPQRQKMKVLASVALGKEEGLSSRDWCTQYGLAAAINAGMYQADYLTHVGYCKVDGKVLNKAANDYLSAMAFDPIDPEDPPFRIFDLDRIELGEVAARYGTVLQNLRLIKRPGENRWQASRENWPEAALGEDWKGRCLLIYCDRAVSMHDFNELLLDLPLGLVAAQHLEGSGPARLCLNHPKVDLKKMPQGDRHGHILPNILGVASSHPQE